MGIDEGITKNIIFHIHNRKEGKIKEKKEI